MTHITKSKSDYTTSSARWRAVVDRDARATCFVYGVRTTKIYCRPSCPARLARRANVEFYDTPKQAETDGYRPCKRCRPEELLPPPDPHIRMAQKACETLALAVLSGAKVRRPTLQDLASEAGLTPSHFHRVFKKVVGITPGKYARDVGEGKTMEHEVNSGFEPYALNCAVAPFMKEPHVTVATTSAAAPDLPTTQAQRNEPPPPPAEQQQYPHVAIPTDWDEFDSILAEVSQQQQQQQHHQHQQQQHQPSISLEKLMGDDHGYTANSGFDPTTEHALFEEPPLSSNNGVVWDTADSTGSLDPWAEFTQSIGKNQMAPSNNDQGRPKSNDSPSSLGSLSAPKTPLDFDPHSSMAASTLLLDELNYLEDTMMFPSYGMESEAMHFRSGV